MPHQKLVETTASTQKKEIRQPIEHVVTTSNLANTLSAFGASYKCFRLLTFIFLAVSCPEISFSQNVECTWSPHFSGISNWVLNINQFDTELSNWDCDHAVLDIGFPHNFSPVGPFFDATIEDAEVFVQPLLPIAISNLDLMNSSSLTLVDGSDFLLQDTGNSGIVNATGDIFLVNTGSALLTELYLDGNIRFMGGGQILMDDSVGNTIRANTAFNANGRLTLENFTVEGAGSVGADELLINIDEDSMIRANGTNPLVIDPLDGASSVFNNGVIQAGGGNIRLFDGGFDNSFGTIEALNNSFVEIVNASVRGGTFASSGSGAIQALGGATFIGPITNHGRLEIPSVTIIFTGDLMNTNQVLIGDESTSAGIVYDIDTDLTGGGEIILSDFSANFITAEFDTTGRLTNFDNTISGSGFLGGRITNLETIRANGIAPLVFQTQGVADGGVNLGLMEATGGSTLELHIVDLQNTGGEVCAVDGGTVALTGSANIQDGLVNIVGPSLLELSEGSVDATVNNNPQGTIATIFGFENLLTGTITNPEDGMIQINDDTRLILDSDGSYNNAGTIKLDGEGTLAGFAGTRLLIDGEVTLQGRGDIELSNAADNTIEARTGNSNTDVMINQDHRIHGSGHIGRNTLEFTNRATIEADQPFEDNASWGTISIDPGGASFHQFINEGVVRARDGGRLELLNGRYNNRTGLIEVNAGSVIDVQQAVFIDGGIIRSNDSGAVNINSEVTLDGLFGLEVDANTIIHQPQGRLNLIGEITNRKTISNDRSGIRIDGEVNLTGEGHVILVDNPSSDLRSFPDSEPDQLNNIDNTISGAGVLAVAIFNQGTIRADGINPLIYNIPAGGFDNQGTVEALGPGGLRLIGGPFNNAGTSNISGGSSLFRDGDYVQTAGSTNVDGTLEVSFLRTIRIQGGMLTGNGNIIGPVEFFGTLAPGNGIGTIQFDSDLSLQANASFEFQIDSAIGTAGENFDSIDCDGTLDFESGAQSMSIKLITLNKQGDPDSLPDFDANDDYVFPVAIADSIVNFNPNDFSFNLDSFGNTFDGEFSVTVGPIADREALIVKYGQFKLGDLNHDGMVNLLDVSPFVDAITSGSSPSEADINCDGAVNLIDVTPFVNLLSG